MILKNAKVFDDNFEIIEADLLIEGEKIAKIAARDTLAEAGQDVYDLSGKLILPGFIDIHIHGCNGADTGEATPEALETMSAYLASNGVTSFCPTSMTLSKEELAGIFANVKSCMDNGVSGAYIQGINMEGPYISMAKKGAQNAAYVRKPDYKEFKELFEGCGGIVKLVDIAPEEEGSDEFIKEIVPICTVSIAHTSADYEQARHSFEQGITHATHLFNAMSGLTHRSPGVVGAIFDSDVTAEIICDGFHINPAVLRIAFANRGEDKICIISDSCSAAGLSDCEIDLGGQTVYVRDGKARLADGTIAASTANMHLEFKNVVSYGIPLKNAVKAATINPAREIRVDDVTGSIKEGKFADIVVLDENSLDIDMVVIKGARYGA